MEGGREFLAKGADKQCRGNGYGAEASPRERIPQGPAAGLSRDASGAMFAGQLASRIDSHDVTVDARVKMAGFGNADGVHALSCQTLPRT